MLTDRYKLHIFDTLIKCVDNKKSILKVNKSKLALLYEACQLDNVNLLKNLIYKDNIDINEGDYDKRCPLHIAIDDNNYESAYILLINGANYKKKDRWDNSMYKMMTQQNKNLIVLFLLVRFNYLKKYIVFNILKNQ